MTQLNIPYQFIAGTKAKASEVNANFDAIANEIDEIYSQMSSNSNDVSSEITSVINSINTVDTKLNNFLATYTENTRFCVNSGNLNSVTGKADILSYSSTVISFNVTSEAPLCATTCSGYEFELEELDDLFLPTLTDGTYTIYTDKDGNVNYYPNVVQRVSELPSAPYVNEVCLIVSKEPLSVYKYSGAEWETFDGVPIGTVEIDDGTIVSVTTLEYNQNGYNINANSFDENLTENGWVQLPNGLIFQWGKYSFSAGEYVSLPIAFPNACFGAVAGDNYNNAEASAHVNISVVSNSQVRLSEGLYASGAQGGAAYVFAYGY